MSCHPWRLFEEQPVSMHASELLNDVSHDNFAASLERSQLQSPTDDSAIGLEFKHLAASVSVAVGRSGNASFNQPALHIQATEKSIAAVLSFNAKADGRIPGNSDMLQDPVVIRLSDALAAAERDQSEFAGIYADAVRLVTIARMVSSYDAPKIEEVRARPDSGGLSKWRLKLVTKYVEEHLDKKITLADMAAAARLSRMHFAALFLRATGLKPHEYLLRQRVKAAQRLLQTSDEPIAQISLSVGFQTQAHFTTVFRRIAGRTPAKWREENRFNVDPVPGVASGEERVAAGY